MTRRGSGVGAVGLGTIVAAWLLGSTALAILGLGLVLAALFAQLWARFATRRLRVERRMRDVTRVEGQPLRIEVALSGRPWLASRVEWRDTLGPLGERRTDVASDGIARIDLGGVPRGRYRLGPGSIAVDDPLGLASVEQATGLETTILVRPRVPELRSLFTETGAWGEGGRRARLRRQSGLEPHGVREYLEGEPLRAVHWPTTARRGELMVRDLEDAPRDSVAVVLDVDAAFVAGEPSASSLDDAVRAVAGLLRVHVARSRSALLVVATPEPMMHRVRNLGRDWEEALDALAGVEGMPGAPLRAVVMSRGAVALVPDLVVVTSRPEVVVDPLLARQAVGRDSAVVAVDSPTYAGRPPSETSPTLLRLAAAGVPVAVLRHGESLVETLTGLRMRAVG